MVLDTEVWIDLEHISNNPDLHPSTSSPEFIKRNFPSLEKHSELEPMKRMMMIFITGRSRTSWRFDNIFLFFSGYFIFRYTSLCKYLSSFN